MQGCFTPIVQGIDIGIRPHECADHTRIPVSHGCNVQWCVAGIITGCHVAPGIQQHRQHVQITITSYSPEQRCFTIVITRIGIGAQFHERIDDISIVSFRRHVQRSLAVVVARVEISADI